MALSGSSYVNVPNHWQLRLEWSATQNISNNTSRVTVRLFWISRTAYGAVHSTAPKTCSIKANNLAWDNRRADGMARLSNGQKKQIHSKTFTVNHNSNGTASLTLDAYFDVLATLDNRWVERVRIGARTWSLDTIPRKSTMSTGRNWTAGLNRTVSISRASSSFNHQVYIDVSNSSGNWVNIKRIDFPVGATSRNTSFTVAENKKIFECLDGRNSTSVRMNLRTYNGSSYLGNNTYTGTVVAPAISTTTRPSSFYIGDTISGSISSNNSRFEHRINLYIDGTFHRVAEDISAGSWSFNTSSLRSELLSAMPNTNTLDGQLRIYTYYEGVRIRNRVDYNIRVQIRSSDEAPTFSGGFTYQDTNQDVINITGNNQYLVTGWSSLRVTIPASARAQPSTGTTMQYYDVTVGNTTQRVNYSTSTINVDFDYNASQQLQSGATLYVRAVDGRGNSTTRSINLQVLNYHVPTVRLRAYRLNGYETTTRLQVTGTIAPLRIGNTDLNSIETLMYRYRREGDEFWSPWDGLGATGIPNYQTNEVSVELDNTASWEVHIQVRDKISGNINLVNRVDPGQPLFFIDPVLKSLGIGDVPTQPDVVQINKRIVFGGTFWGSEGGLGEGVGGLEMNNSDIIQANGIYFNDVSDANNGEGLLFLKTGAPRGSTQLRDHYNFLVRDGVGYLDNNPVMLNDAIGDPLWQGRIYMQASQTITPSRALGDCPNGWILIWSRYEEGQEYDDQWSFTFIPKMYRPHMSTNGGMGLIVGATGDQVYRKYLYVPPGGTTITGHDNNRTEPQNQTVLRFVFAF